MTFRPYPGFTIATAIMLSILLGLGFWQLERRKGKLAQIAQVNGHMAAEPIPLDAVLKLDAEDAMYRRVMLTGRFDHAKEAYVFATAPGGDAVYHVLTPFTDRGRVLLVDRGEVPKEKLKPDSRAEGNVEGETSVTGVWRVPDLPGSFTPAPDLAHRIWYARDLAGIAAADRLALAAPVLVEADATPNPGGWPKGGQTVVSFRNEHLNYAITWFCLAAGLLGIWVAYHVSRGRIAFR